MKNKLVIKALLISAFALLMTGCLKESNNKNSDNKEEYFKRAYYDEIIGMVSEECCFPSNTGDVLKLYNAQTEEPVIFCFDPTCTHPDPTMGSKSPCFAKSHQTEDFPMLSSRYLYFYEKESIDSSKLIRADKDTKNQKVIAEFEGIAVQALYCDDTVITIVEKEYHFDSDGIFERMEKKQIFVYATNVRILLILPLLSYLLWINMY